MPASVVRPTWIYTIMATLAIIALAACVASDTPREPAPAADTPTPDSPTPSEIGIDPRRPPRPSCSSWTSSTSRSITA